MNVITPAIVLYTLDEEKVVKFYSSLGLRFEKEKHGGGPVHYACALGGMTIEIYPWPGGYSQQMRSCVPDYRIVLPVEHMTEALRGVSEFSKEIAPPRKTELGVSALIKDPDGRHVLLIETQQG